MLKRFPLPMDPYGSRVILCRGSNAELNAYLKRTLGKDCPAIIEQARAHTTIVTPETAPPTHYVCIVNDLCDSRFERIGVLAHELIHVVMSIFEFRGVKVTADNDEPVAYYYEWLFRHCAKALW